MLNRKLKENHPIIRCKIIPKELRDKLFRDYHGRKVSENTPSLKVAAEHKREGLCALKLPGAVFYAVIGNYGVENSSMPISYWIVSKLLGHVWR